MNKSEKLYCSLDIETSGFDPLTSEILEVGFVFFSLGEKSFKITEQWTQVFKPARSVPPGILALTGISLAELEAAPKFSEHQKFLQDKLSQAVIVGHNIVFDINFLEGYGIKFSGESIDTLELAQWLLPTHHSYNLENLMHTFNISHKEAHRALADSKATLKLLEKLLQIYSGFPPGLKKQVEKLAEDQDFCWKNLLHNNFEGLTFMAPERIKTRKQPEKKITGLKITPSSYYNFPLGLDYIENLALTANTTKTLLVLPKSHLALDLYKRGLAEAAVFLPEQQFNKNNFTTLLNKTNLTSEETKFLLKVLVWQQTNWQSETLLDLNLSFFGGQFKTLVTGGELSENRAAGLVVCDLPTFFQLSEQKLYTSRQVIICGLNEFENAVTSNIGTKTSWGYISYLLKSFYNPEADLGQKKFQVSVEAALLAADLFFGLVNALFQTEPPSFQYVKISDGMEQTEKYQKIKQASENYLIKLREANLVLASQQIEKFGSDLENFFKEEPNRVKWLELSEYSCSFLSMPLDITELVKQAIGPFKTVSFADALDNKVLPKFFLKRLGLENLSVREMPDIKPSGKRDQTKQGDLFEGFRKTFVKKSLYYHCVEQTADAQLLLKLAGNPKTLPGAILFSGPLQVREFYEQHYQQLKQQASVLAQTSSGGSNKIFRNFSINKKSLLLATDKFVLKAFGGPSAVESVTNLAVKTLVLCRLPFEQFTHPYQEALAKAWPNAFEDYSLPRAFFNFQTIIKFFYTPELKDIYVVDAKLSKAYAKIFKDYWQNLPGAEFKSG